MRSKPTSPPKHLENPAEGAALASFPAGDCLDDFNLRQTLNDIVVGTASFQAFREALVRFRGYLH